MTKLEKLVQCITRPHVYIQTHNYPDPDALSSARGLQYLLEFHGISSTICYKGQIDKCNTLQMIQLLQLEIHPEAELSLTEADEIILVDCQKGNNNVKDFLGEEIACIDHHMLQGTDCYRFFDIRSGVGSCATLIASYFIENKVDIPEDIATLLVYGLKVDTANLTRSVTNLDVDMFSIIFKLANKPILQKLESSNLSLIDLTSYAKAIENLRIYGQVGITNIGNDCSEAIIGTLSDFILSIDEIHFSVVYSYRAGGIKFSVRSDTPSYDAAKIIKESLKKYGDGGGHSRMAAGFIPEIPFDRASDIAASIEDNILQTIEKEPLTTS
ncbi:MAG: hypothetical protein PWP24_1502 [Clostridiales bacterium]|nr:hypothetical protein [Clostridiales bacterium]